MFSDLQTLGKTYFIFILLGKISKTKNWEKGPSKKSLTALPQDRGFSTSGTLTINKWYGIIGTLSVFFYVLLDVETGGPANENILRVVYQRTG